MLLNLFIFHIIEQKFNQCLFKKFVKASNIIIERNNKCYDFIILFEDIKIEENSLKNYIFQEMKVLQNVLDFIDRIIVVIKIPSEQDIIHLKYCWTSKTENNNSTNFRENFFKFTKYNYELKISTYLIFFYKICNKDTFYMHFISEDAKKYDILQEKFKIIYNSVSNKYAINKKLIILYYEIENFFQDTIFLYKEVYVSKTKSDMKVKCYYNVIYSLLINFLEINSNVESNIIKYRYLKYEDKNFDYDKQSPNIIQVQQMTKHFFDKYQENIDFRKKINYTMIGLLLNLLDCKSQDLYLYSKFLYKMIEIESRLNECKLRIMVIDIFLAARSRAIYIYNIDMEIEKRNKNILENMKFTDKNFYYIKKIDFTSKDFERFIVYCDKYAVNKVQNVIENINIVKINQNQVNLIKIDESIHIHIDLDPFLLFITLCKALCYDYVPTIRTLIIISALCYENQHERLKKSAHRFMRDYKGKWFDFNLAKNRNINFVMFILQYSEYCLNDEEIIFLETIKNITLLNYYRQSPEKMKIFLKKYQKYFNDTKLFIEYYDSRICKDFKGICKSCKKEQSFTLLLSGKCISCCEKEENSKKVTNNNILMLKKGNSIHIKCNKCFLIFAVSFDKGDKCYFCDSEKIKYANLTLSRCQICQNKFMKLIDKTCVFCKNNEPLINNDLNISYVILEICFEKMCLRSDIFKEFLNDESKLYSISKDDLLNLASIYTQELEKYILNHLAKANSFQSPLFIKNMRNIQNQMNFETKKQSKTSKVIFIAEMVEIEFYKVGEADHKLECLICFELFEIYELYSICGRKNTDCLFCPVCIISRFEGINPGSFINSSILSCPLCKNKLRIDFVKQFNLIFAQVLQNSENEEINEDAVNFVCFSCNTIKNDKIVEQSQDKIIICYKCLSNKNSVCANRKVEQNDATNSSRNSVLYSDKVLSECCDQYFCRSCHFQGNRISFIEHIFESNRVINHFEEHELCLLYNNYVVDDVNWSFNEKKISNLYFNTLEVIIFNKLIKRKISDE